MEKHRWIYETAMENWRGGGYGRGKLVDVVCWDRMGKKVKNYLYIYFSFSLLFNCFNYFVWTSINLSFRLFKIGQTKVRI